MCTDDLTTKTCKSAAPSPSADDDDDDDDTNTGGKGKVPVSKRKMYNSCFQTMYLKGLLETFQSELASQFRKDRDEPW